MRAHVSNVILEPPTFDDGKGGDSPGGGAVPLRALDPAEAEASPAPRPATVLVVDDEPMALDSLELTLKRQWRVLRAASGGDALAVLAREPVDVVIADQRMPGMTGVELLEHVYREHPDVTRVLLTGYTDLEGMLAAVNRGHVYFYLTKPWDPAELRAHVERAFAARRVALEQQQALTSLRAANAALASETASLRDALGGPARFEDFAGTSAGLREALDLAARVASSDVTVLLEGESGTGKERLARAIHAASPRARQPFVAVNCGALPESLLESELFGHARGAFTGAVTDKKGLFEEANGGTLLLDEVGDTSLAMQVKLLRALQERTIRPVGTTLARPVDVRLISATHRDLGAMVRSGQFREDFYYRISTFPIRLPPLRERVEDIPALATQLLARAERRLRRNVRGLAVETYDLLLGYPFPGNVRELENELERALVLAEPNDWIAPALFSARLRGLQQPRPSASAPTNDPQAAPTEPPPSPRRRARRTLAEARAEFERSLIEEALSECHGNVSRAARILGLSRSGLQKRMKALGVGPARGDDDSDESPGL